MHGPAIFAGKYTRLFTVGVVLAVHILGYFMLTAARHLRSEPPSAAPPLSVVTILRLNVDPVPTTTPPSPAQAPRLLVPDVNLDRAITLPDLAPRAVPPAPGLDVLGVYVRCTMPEHRDTKECERVRAAFRGKDAPRQQSEAERIMMARIDREMARRDAPTAVPCIGVSRSGMSCIAAPEWNDQHFRWK